MAHVISYTTAVENLEKNPKKKLMWQSGLTFKGAEKFEISRNPKDYPKKERVYADGYIKTRVKNSWKDDLKAKFDWACVVYLVSDDSEEMYLKGLSESDMF